MISSLPVIFWVILGIGLIAVEFVITGIGLLFLGIGSLLNAILISNFPLAYTHQYISFGLLSLICLILLWRPLKKFSKNTSTTNIDLIGSRVKVINKPMILGQIGEVIWSGTIMNAMLATDNQISQALVGDELFVDQIKGNILICRNHNPNIQLKS